jgi:hypothetical protein
MYVTGIVHLVEHKEISLIDAVEGGRLPISVAAQIASASALSRTEPCLLGKTDPPLL